ncbi:MAG: BatA and WFA domain-containing protein [Myxococcaceae bacterium]
MTAAAPLGFLALTALVPLFLAYFLRRRQKPRVVSALFLWRTPSQRAQAGPRFERFSRETSFLLETAMIITAALFLADVRCGKDAPKKHVVAVLDGSLSMRARTGSDTAAQKAVRALAKAAGDDGADLLTVVESGPHPRVIAGPQMETSRAIGVLSSWTPAQPAHDFGPALTLARELSSAKNQRIYLFTDGPAAGEPVWPPEVEVKSVGEPADNVAFLSAQRRDESGVARLTFRIGNFSKQKKTVELLVSGDGVQQKTKVELEAGGSSVVRLGLKTSGSLTATLPDDALKDDSSLTLPPAPVQEITVAELEGLDANAQAALRRFFAVANQVKLATDGKLRIGPPGTNANITLGATGKLRSFVGPFFAEKDDPLLDDVELAGVVWTAGENPRGRPLISMGEAVLMSVEEDGRLHFNLDLARSDVQRTAAWPILMSNVLRDARLKLPGFPRKLLMLGEPAEVVTAAGARYAMVAPSGTKKPLFGAGAARIPLAEAGEWKLLADGDVVDALAVLPLDARESDLSARGPYEVHATALAGLVEFGAERPRPRWMLALLLLLLLVDFWVTARTPSVSPKGERA